MKLPHKSNGYEVHQGRREEIMQLAWEQWLKHTQQCEACTELQQAAMKGKDEDTFSAAWIIGFATAMDMMEAGHLRPAEGQN
jgi:hypothetical protein